MWKFISPGPERDVHIPLSYLGGIHPYLSFNIYYIRIRPQPVRRRHDTGLHPVRICLSCLISIRHLPEGWGDWFDNATASTNTSLNLSGICRRKCILYFNIITIHYIADAVIYLETVWTELSWRAINDFIIQQEKAMKAFGRLRK